MPMKASDIMTEHVVSVPPDTGILEAVEKMLSSRIAGMPVVDDEQRLVGIITEGDLLRRWELGTQRRHTGFAAFKAGMNRVAADYLRSHGARVRNLMTQNVVAIEESTPLEDIVRDFEKHGFKQVPVLRAGKVIGLVSRADILRAFVAAARNLQPHSQSDEDIRRALYAIYTEETWAPLDRVDLAVANGIVDLFGTVENEIQRDALVVAAESVPGVKYVRDYLTSRPGGTDPTRRESV
jgi:CBS domain-containing protein